MVAEFAGRDTGVNAPVHNRESGPRQDTTLGLDMTERTSPEAIEPPENGRPRRRLHLREVTREDSSYDGLGADLRAARSRSGLDLSEVADDLRIRAAHIEAIERGKFDDLPATVYAIGFIRSYAEYLGLDGQVAVEAFKQEVAGLRDDQKLVFPSPLPESRVPKGWLLALAFVLAGMIYAGWYYAETTGRLATDVVPPVPERLDERAGVTPAAEQPAAAADQSELTTTATEPAAYPGDAVPGGRPESADAATTAPAVAAPQATAPAEAGPGTTEPGVSAAGASAAGASGNVTSRPAEQEPVASGERVGEIFASMEPTQEYRRPVPSAGAKREESAGSVAVAPPRQPPPTSAPAAGPGTTGRNDVSGDVATADPSPNELAAIDENTRKIVTATDSVTVPSAEMNAAAVSPEPAAEEGGTPPAGTATRAEPITSVPAVARERSGGQVTSASGGGNTGANNAGPDNTGGGAQAAGPRVFGEGNWDARVILRARQDVWVQVVAPDGALLLSRILNPGDQFLVPNRDGITMMTGNAGGLEITVDGRTVPALGPSGSVRHDVSLVPDRLVAGTAANR